MHIGEKTHPIHGLPLHWLIVLLYISFLILWRTICQLVPLFPEWGKSCAVLSYTYILKSVFMFSYRNSSTSAFALRPRIHLELIFAQVVDMNLIHLSTYGHLVSPLQLLTTFCPVFPGHIFTLAMHWHSIIKVFFLLVLGLCFILFWSIGNLIKVLTHASKCSAIKLYPRPLFKVFFPFLRQHLLKLHRLVLNLWSYRPS